MNSKVFYSFVNQNNKPIYKVPFHFIIVIISAYETGIVKIKISGGY